MKYISEVNMSLIKGEVLMFQGSLEKITGFNKTNCADDPQINRMQPKLGKIWPSSKKRCRLPKGRVLDLCNLPRSCNCAFISEVQHATGLVPLAQHPFAGAANEWTAQCRSSGQHNRTTHSGNWATNPMQIQCCCNWNGGAGDYRNRKWAKRKKLEIRREAYGGKPSEEFKSELRKRREVAMRNIRENGRVGALSDDISL